ncbi:response regulator [Pseudoclavibacter sp. CFCC 13611]|uniref:response regulator n=1 Tax=Pseudoclavibacter sp. CFCC 13611 TaxID=2615178 RepID=UPI0013014AF3|nr:response regulator transcription factor [Pseudoclavibacter sp. CFCC 13611]KAB1662654.1 response regulator transcription factor [Pseudoclavibacter sp. CFCC 13611]
MSTIRLAIADDHPIVRSGLVALLGDLTGIDLIGEASDGNEAVALVTAEHPDVLLCDLRMPGRDGVEVTRVVSEQAPETRVIILTTYEDDAAIVAAIAAGAKGYLIKAAPADELIAGVRAVVAGEVALSPQVATALVSRLQRSAVPDTAGADFPEASEVDEVVEVAADALRWTHARRISPLSPRETEVLRLVAQGMRNAQIAERLYISEPTVKTHLLRTYQKLEVNDRTRAVTKALELGLI